MKVLKFINKHKNAIYALCIITIIAIVSLIIYYCVESSNSEHFGSDKLFVCDKKFCSEKFKELRCLFPIFYKLYFSQDMNIPNKNVKPNTKINKIFVSVASYRDDQCLETIKSMIERADHPENLVICVCQQNSILEKDCFQDCNKSIKTDSFNKSCPSAKIERLAYTSARGPTWARWRLQRKWDGEEYYLQIDAHMRFVKSWDTLLKDQLSLCPSNKPVLTQYPLEYTINKKTKASKTSKEKDLEKDEEWQVDKMRNGLYVQKFNNPDGFYRIQSDFTEERRSQPFSATCWAAGFSFSRADFFWDVGYDPYTPFLFFGEEMDIAIRGWTHGYDFFSPSENIVFHNYKREHRKTFWENPFQSPLEVLSRFRIYVRLGYIKPDDIPKKYKFILKNIEKFPMGNKRSIEDYEKFSGLELPKFV